MIRWSISLEGSRDFGLSYDTVPVYRTAYRSRDAKLALAQRKVEARGAPGLVFTSEKQLQDAAALLVACFAERALSGQLKPPLHLAQHRSDKHR